MTTRAIFNRKYESYTPGGTEVYLLNGAGVTTNAITTQLLTAGTTLVQGDVVYVSGVYALLASAASGVDATRYNPIGITATSASPASGVEVILDDVATVSAVNLIGEVQMIPGQYYYLSKYAGKITRFSTASGLVTSASGYAALVNLGQALSPSELEVEIEPPVILNN